MFLGFTLFEVFSWYIGTFTQVLYLCGITVMYNFEVLENTFTSAPLHLFDSKLNSYFEN